MSSMRDQIILTLLERCERLEAQLADKEKILQEIYSGRKSEAQQITNTLLQTISQTNPKIDLNDFMLKFEESKIDWNALREQIWRRICQWINRKGIDQYLNISDVDLTNECMDRELIWGPQKLPSIASILSSKKWEGN